MENCRYCNHENVAGSLICVNCGQRLTRGTHKLAPISPLIVDPAFILTGTDTFGSRARLSLIFGPADSVMLDLGDGERITIGRVDHLTRSLPTINLASRGGWNCGVSRMHCALMRQGESLFITDLNSTNGTWVNEKRLPPDQPVRLHDGAQIRLGLQKISVAFVMVDVEELVPGD